MPSFLEIFGRIYVFVFLHRTPESSSCPARTTPRRADSVKFYFARWGNDSNRRINPLILLRRLDSRPLTLVFGVKRCSFGRSRWRAETGLALRSPSGREFRFVTTAGQLQLKRSPAARRGAPPAGAARLIRLDDSISIDAHENVGKRMGIGEEVDLALEREPGPPAWRTSRRDSWAGILHLWDRGGMEERLRAPSPMEAAAKTRGNAEALRSPRSDVIRRGRGRGRLCLVTLRLQMRSQLSRKSLSSSSDLTLPPLRHFHLSVSDSTPQSGRSRR